MSAVSPAAAQAGYSAINVTTYETEFSSLLYGIYATLAFAAMWIVVRRGVTNGRALMLSILAIMFSASTVSFVLGCITNVWQAQMIFFPEVATPQFIHRFYLVDTAGLVFVRLNYILSDLIVVWRAWVIWGRSPRVLALVSFFMLGTIGEYSNMEFIASEATDAGLTLSQLFNDNTSSNNLGPIKGGERAMILVLPTLATNLVSMFLITLKAWYHRKVIKTDFGEGNVSSRAMVVLTWVVESAVIYCVLWILYIFAFFELFTDVGLNIFDGCMVQFSGIYPTAIIVLVALNRSECDRYSSVIDESLKFASVPIDSGMTHPDTTTAESAHGL
ncbi:hypothetical protein BT96DRAFT_1018635 [Gymnopus androsaceus JB14]|uniref:Family A G protein-coupled receptor-like protein n=1 Tax=Gymnopus androsaceus JB14 TaxID=1447944 RepID=A0A6A4HV66_9AGAR|nr:hypothetical protein BT96DRAFT_1018635 [Gymnopus androsaceus JB14]